MKGGLESQLLPDRLAAAVLELGVPGNRCPAARSRMFVNDVPRAVSLQLATRSDQLPQKMRGDHNSIGIFFELIAAIESGASTSDIIVR